MSKEPSLHLVIEPFSTDQSSPSLPEKYFIALKKELQGLDIDSVSSGSAQPHDQNGAMGDPIGLSQILLTLGAAAIPALIDLLKDWCSRRSGRCIKLRLSDKGKNRTIFLELGQTAEDITPLRISQIVDRLTRSHTTTIEDPENTIEDPDDSGESQNEQTSHQSEQQGFA